MVQESTVEKSCSSKPGPSGEDISAMEELMSSGKRHYICNEPQLALDCFAELCEKLAIFYGQTANECSEAYLYYGKTLLEIARLENGVLGHAVKEAPVLGEDGEDTETDTKMDEDDEELTAEKRVELRANVEHAMREGNLYNEATTEDEETEEEGEPEDTDAESKEAQEPGTSSKEEQPKGDLSGDDVMEEVPAKDEEVNEDEEEDISNMQLAWEMFELACLILNRQIRRGSKDCDIAKSRMAEAKYGLAQISLESEHYEEAVKDFKMCLDLYKEFLEDKNDRRFAEVHYNIALALSFDKKFDEAIEQYNYAVTILKARISDLEMKVKEAEEKGEKEKASSDLEEWSKEINELRDLVVLDMMAKIEDAQEMKTQADESIKTIKEAAKEILGCLGTSNGFDKGFDEGFDAPMTTEKTAEVVNDISHKIRSSKRKPEDDDSVVNAKKVKQVGDMDGNRGQTNGHATTEA